MTTINAAADVHNNIVAVVIMRHIAMTLESRSSPFFNSTVTITTRRAHQLLSNRSRRLKVAVHEYRGDYMYIASCVKTLLINHVMFPGRESKSSRFH